MRVLLYLTITLLLIACNDAQAKDSTTKRPFVMLHDINYIGVPDLPIGRIKSMNTKAEQYYLDGADVLNDQPDEKTVRELSLQVGDYFYLNIEHLPTSWRDTEPEQEKSMKKLSKIFHWIKKDRPTITVGIYRILPERGTDYYNYWTNPAWHERNDRWKHLASFVDAIYPSLYTFHKDDIAEWRAYADANLIEAKKYNKPIIVFLWPQYHPATNPGGLGLIAGKFWKAQLKWAYDNTDGIVIWSGTHLTWIEAITQKTRSGTNWWDETEKFMNDSNL